MRANKTLLELGQKLDDKDIQGSAYCGIASCYERTKDQNQALRYDILAAKALYDVNKWDRATKMLSYAATAATRLRKFGCVRKLDAVILYLITEKGATVAMGNDKMIAICGQFNVKKPTEEEVITILETAAARATATIAEKGSREDAALGTALEREKPKPSKSDLIAAYEGGKWERLKDLLATIISPELAGTIVGRLKTGGLSLDDFKQYINTLCK